MQDARRPQHGARSKAIASVGFLDGAEFPAGSAAWAKVPRRRYFVANGDSRRKCERSLLVGMQQRGSAMSADLQRNRSRRATLGLYRDIDLLIAADQLASLSRRYAVRGPLCADEAGRRCRVAIGVALLPAFGVHDKQYQSVSRRFTLSFKHVLSQWRLDPRRNRIKMRV